MPKPKFYLDEDTYLKTAAALRERGIDTIAAGEAGNYGLTDETQLEYATREGRVLYSFNTKDFDRINRQWISSGKSHAGIIVSPYRVSLGNVIRQIEKVYHQYSAEEMANRIVYV